MGVPPGAGEKFPELASAAETENIRAALIATEAKVHARTIHPLINKELTHSFFIFRILTLNKMHILLSSMHCD